MIFDMRGLMAEEYLDAGLWNKDSFNYRFINRLERYLIKSADEVIVITNKARDLLAGMGRLKNITVIPTCVDLERFNLRKDYVSDNRFILIYTGSLGTWYMISEMMDFYKELTGVYKDSAFFILSQTEKSWIERQVSYELKDKVIIDSAKPEKVPQIMTNANVGIFFIKPCFSKTASSPTKFGEYLACGLPVIINKGIGDTEKIVKDNRIGVVVENFSVLEYKNKIIEMKALLKEGEDLRKRCKRTAEKYFSLKEGVEKYYNIYKRLETVLN
jgi:glycosyltransferase involved in cell wall biosynthesis